MDHSASAIQLVSVSQDLQINYNNINFLSCIFYFMTITTTWTLSNELYSRWYWY